MAAYVQFIRLFISLNLAICSYSLQCLDNNGKEVDWFVIYKLPKLKHTSEPLVQAGLGSFYLDAKSQHWSLASVSLNDTGQALYYTLQQVYKNHKSKDVMYLLYNDEAPPKHVSLSHGHTKGDVAFDKTSGYWLVHSLPRFPPHANETYSYPESGTHYGQTFLCVSLHYKYLNQIGKQMMYNYPQIYDYNVPPKFAADNPNIMKSIDKTHVNTPPWNNSITMESLGGQKFVSFAKFTKFGADLYDSWLAPYFKSSLDVESWQNGINKTKSSCSKYQVKNIQDLSIKGIAFKETLDHSKWAVTTTGDKWAAVPAAKQQQWICIGDINRMDTQKERAGGTVCSLLPQVWSSFKQSITQVEQCPPRPQVVGLR